MNPTIRPRPWLALAVALLTPAFALGDGPTSTPTATPTPTKPSEAEAKAKPDANTPTAAPTPPQLPSISLLDAMKSGDLSVAAEGSEDGNMIINVTNNTSRKLRVVLPPGLVASNAAGQMMGGMGGMGMGGMGMGGMGGMGGGMGGMGGGMGGMGGGMGGRGGMGGGMMGGGRMLVMPPQMGLMMLARLIMYFAGDIQSWNPRSLMIGMMMGGGMGMGGMGMGGMGGGMGGMGMGGGFRSVPPTDLPNAVLKPGESRRLATRAVSLSPPDPESGVVLPRPGEPLLLGDIAQVNPDMKVQKALRRLAADKAPETIAQLVLWNLACKLDWATIAQLARGYVNDQELALARQLAERIDALPDGEAGRLYIEVNAAEPAHQALAADFGKLLDGRSILGLKAASGVPKYPAGPAVGCKVQIVGDPDKPEALVQVAESNGHREWRSMGKFTLPIPLDDKDKAKAKRDLPALGDTLAQGILDHLVRARVIRTKKLVEGTPNYTLQVDNASPLLLNGLAVVGTQAKPTDPAHFLLGISLPPQWSMQIPLTTHQVDIYGMKKGTRVVALDLSAL